MDDEISEEWQRALRYGTPVTLPAPLVTDLNFGLPGGLDATAQTGSLRIGPARREDARPYRLRLQVVDPDGQLLEEAVLDMDPITRGISGQGWRAHGFAPARTFDIELICDLGDGTSENRLNFSVTVGVLSGEPPVALRPGISLLAAMHDPNRIRFAPEYGPADESTFPIPSAEPAVTEELVELIDALADLQEAVDGSLRTPDLDQLTASTFRDVRRAARLVRGETLSETWTRQEISVALARLPPDPTAPVQLALSGSSSITIGDQTVVLDPLTMVLLAATLETVEKSDGSTVIRATPALDNDTMLTRRATIEEMPPQSLS